MNPLLAVLPAETLGVLLLLGAGHVHAFYVAHIKPTMTDADRAGVRLGGAVVALGAILTAVGTGGLSQAVRPFLGPLVAVLAVVAWWLWTRTLLWWLANRPRGRHT